MIEVTFCAILGKVGQLFIPSSGHTSVRSEDVEVWQTFDTSRREWNGEKNGKHFVGIYVATKSSRTES